MKQYIRKFSKQNERDWTLFNVAINWGLIRYLDKCNTLYVNNLN